MRHRAIFPLTILSIVLMVAACAPTAAAPTPTAAARPTAAAKPSSAEIAAALTSVPKPAASPAAEGARVNGPKQYASPPLMTIEVNKSYTATIKTTLGTMKADLFVKDAPATVNNFVFLARDGFYDGVTFHRVIKGFMAQTGDPTGTGRGGPGYRFNDEPVTRKYERGTLAMANAGPNTNGSQFFIVHQDYRLPPNYTIFGKVTEGVEVLDKITAVPTGPGKGGPDTPQTEIRIESIQVDEH